MTRFMETPGAEPWILSASPPYRDDYLPNETRTVLYGWNTLSSLVLGGCGVSVEPGRGGQLGGRGRLEKVI